MSGQPFNIVLTWQSHHKNFTYNEYSREYLIQAENKPTLVGTAAPEYKGALEQYNPEDLLVASLSACHMLSFLALASNSKIHVISYQDEAQGFLHKEGNIIKFKEVFLRPRITIDANSDCEKANTLHDKAHHICFIANSVNFPVQVEPRCEVQR